MLVQRRPDTRAALRLMRKLLKKQGFAPKLLMTDDWNQTLYSLRFAVSLPVAVKPYDTFMSDRTREIVQLTIDRLGHGAATTFRCSG